LLETEDGILTSVIGYIRVSTKEQGQKHSLATQKSHIQTSCRKNGWNLFGIVQDCESGTSMEREGINELKSNLCTNEIDGVIVWKLDRLSRSLIDGKIFLSLLEEKGIFFKSLSEPLIDTTTPLGSMILNLLFTFAEFERELLRERINGGKKRAYDEGLRPHGRIPIGYSKDDSGIMTIDPYGANLVRKIYSLRKRNLSYRKILCVISDQVSESRKPNPFSSHVSVAQILHNRTYLGEVKYKGVWKRAEHPPVISKRLFNSVQ
jgi:site-specific DNA recombinase